MENMGVNIMDETDWKKAFYECKIQGIPVNEFFWNFTTYKDFEKAEWSSTDYENIIKAYSIILTHIEKVRYELEQFESLKNKFEDVFKIKYGSKTDQSLNTKS